jgi:glycosyltransferase involved in cell wall biosynthesis
MHLAFINNLYPPYVVGGYEMICDEVVRALRARGHRVSVLCGRGLDLPSHPDLSGALEIDLDRKEETFLGGRLPSPWEAFRLHLFSPRSYGVTRRWLLAKRPDVVVVWNLYMTSLSPLVAALSGQAPVVVQVLDKWLYFSLFDLEALLKPVVPWKRLALRAARFGLQPILRRWALPHRVVAVSEFMKSFYVRAGLDAGEIEVIHLGVPTRTFAVAPRGPRLASEPLRILFVGSLWEGKGPQTAVRALGQLRRDGIRARLDICGEGTGHFVEFLKRVIEEEGVFEDVTLHGKVERDVVRDFCRSHDVLVFPSEWDEPFAAVPIEAMSSGMAVVATSAGGTPEAIVDGETGIVVAPGDPKALAKGLRRLAEDDALRLRLGERAAQVARERFNLDLYIDRLEAYYRGCIRAGTAGR